MKREHMVLLAGLGLVFVFITARNLYKKERTEKTAVMAEATASPLSRAYAQSSGPTDAKVVIVEFFDPGCETCSLLAPRVKGLIASHPGKIRLVLRYAPFHQGADTMVKILEAARQQGKYWETLKVMFDTQSHWASHHQPEPEKIWGFLPSAGLDVEKIKTDMNDPKILEIIRQDMADAQALGVRKTPTFFVNGKPLPSFGLAQLKALVDAEVAANYGRPPPSP